MRARVADDVDEQAARSSAAPLCWMATETGIMPAISTTVVQEIAR